jgi:nucleotide-binding universal stress UspA family protein
MNFKITHILTPVDFSETSMQALDCAIFMAKIFKAKLSLVHVMEPLRYADEFTGTTMIDTSIDKHINQKLNELANLIHLNHGILKPDTILEEGNISDTIVETAETIKADIIVMGTHGTSGWAEFFIGSNTYKVVTQSTCPVLSVQHHAPKRGFRKIVLPIDDSIPSRQKVIHAVEFAKHYGSIIHVVGLITVDEPEVHKKFDIMMNQVNEYLKKNDVPFENKILMGSNIAKMAMKYASDVEADLIMIMTEQEESVTGFIVGPYAQQVVNHSPIPVLSITPQETYITEMVHPY